MLVERRFDCVRRTSHEERVAVRWRSYDEFGADIAPGAWSVLNDEWLCEPLRQPLTHEASDDVGRATGRRDSDQAHGPHWPGLRPCNARHRRERGGARCQMQKPATGTFHNVPPASFRVNERRSDNLDLIQ